MYTDIEYKARIKEIEPMALALVTSFKSKDATIIVSKINSEDSYILGMHIGHLLQIDNKETLSKCGPLPEKIRKKIDEQNTIIENYDVSVYYNSESRLLELLAMEMIMEKRPKDVREFASKLDSIDAYILGQHIGGLLAVGYHETGQDKRKVKLF